jgi:hypothetical protein
MPQSPSWKVEAAAVHGLRGLHGLALLWAGKMAADVRPPSGPKEGEPAQIAVGQRRDDRVGRDPFAVKGSLGVRPEQVEPLRRDLRLKYVLHRILLSLLVVRAPKRSLGEGSGLDNAVGDPIPATFFLLSNAAGS